MGGGGHWQQGEGSGDQESFHHASVATIDGCLSGTAQVATAACRRRRVGPDVLCAFGSRRLSWIAARHFGCCCSRWRAVKGAASRRHGPVFVGRLLDHWTGPNRVVGRFEVERAAKGVGAPDAPNGAGRVGRLRPGLHHRRAVADPRLHAVPVWPPADRGSRHAAGGRGLRRQLLHPGLPTPARCFAAAATSADASSDPRRHATPASMPWTAGSVETPTGVAGVMDKDGWFLLRDVPLRPARPLHVATSPANTAAGRTHCPRGTRHARQRPLAPTAASTHGGREPARRRDQPSSTARSS